VVFAVTENRLLITLSQLDEKENRGTVCIKFQTCPPIGQMEVPWIEKTYLLYARRQL
jgi:hypothetical protein